MKFSYLIFYCICSEVATHHSFLTIDMTFDLSAPGRDGLRNPLERDARNLETHLLGRIRFVCTVLRALRSLNMYLFD